ICLTVRVKLKTPPLLTWRLHLVVVRLRLVHQLAPSALQSTTSLFALSKSLTMQPYTPAAPPSLAFRSKTSRASAQQSKGPQCFSALGVFLFRGTLGIT